MNKTGKENNDHREEFIEAFNKAAELYRKQLNGPRIGTIENPYCLYFSEPLMSIARDYYKNRFVDKDLVLDSYWGYVRLVTVPTFPKGTTFYIYNKK